MSATLVEFSGVTLGYGAKAILTDLTFAIRAGESVGLVGANGSGKTTILRAILGRIRPLRGQVRLQAARGSGRLRIGYVPQREAVNTLIPFTALEVVQMVATAQRTAWGWSRREDRERAQQALGDVGLDALAQRAFRDLSGGQRQRVLLARALAIQPDILLLDEPTTGLDLRSEVALLALIRDLRTARGLTVLVVTHTLSQVACEADQVLLLQDGAALFGPTATVLNDETLSTLVGLPVRVSLVHGHRVVIAGEGRL